MKSILGIIQPREVDDLVFPTVVGPPVIIDHALTVNGSLGGTRRNTRRQQRAKNPRRIRAPL